MLGSVEGCYSGDTTLLTLAASASAAIETINIKEGESTSRGYQSLSYMAAYLAVDNSAIVDASVSPGSIRMDAYGTTYTFSVEFIGKNAGSTYVTLYNSIGGYMGEVNVNVDHDWSDWVVKTPATCLTAGVEERV